MIRELKKIKIAEISDSVNRDKEMEQINQCTNIIELGYTVETAIETLKQHGIPPVLTEEDKCIIENDNVEFNSMDDFIAVHKDMFLPVDSKILCPTDAKAKMTDSVFIADRTYEIEYDYPRDTVHFALNGEVEEIGADGSEWDKFIYAMLVPLKEVPIGELGRYSLGDTFSDGSVELSNKSWVLIPKGAKAKFLEMNKNFKGQLLEYEGKACKDYANTFLTMLGYKFEDQKSRDATWMDQEDAKKAEETLEKNGKFGHRHYLTKAEIKENKERNRNKLISLLMLIKEKEIIQNFEGINILKEYLQLYLRQTNVMLSINKFIENGFEIDEKTHEIIDKYLKVEEYWSDSKKTFLSEKSILDIVSKLPEDTKNILVNLFIYKNMDNANSSLGINVIVSECLACIIRENIKEFEEETGITLQQLRGLGLSEAEVDHLLLSHEILPKYTIEELKNAGVDFSIVNEEELKKSEYEIEEIVSLGGVLGEDVNYEKLKKEPRKINRKEKVLEALKKTIYGRFKYNEEFSKLIRKLNTEVDFVDGEFIGLDNVINELMDIKEFEELYDGIDYARCGLYNDEKTLGKLYVSAHQKYRAKKDNQEITENDIFNSVLPNNLQEYYELCMWRSVMKNFDNYGENIENLVKMRERLLLSNVIVNIIRTASFECETGLNISDLLAEGFSESELEELITEYDEQKIDRKAKVQSLYQKSTKMSI